MGGGGTERGGREPRQRGVGERRGVDGGGVEGGGGGRRGVDGSRGGGGRGAAVVSLEAHARMPMTPGPGLWRIWCGGRLGRV